MSRLVGLREDVKAASVAVPIEQGFGVYVEGFVLSLKESVARVETGWELIMTPSSEFDFLIVQWPEWVAYALKIGTSEVLDLLHEWKKKGVHLGVVIHNSTPHKEYLPARDLYDALVGVFDFAIHLEEPSIYAFPNWAQSHHVLPHPLVPFDEWEYAGEPNERRRHVLVLGQLRRREERKLLFRFAVAARLRGQKLFIGGYRRFNEPLGVLSKWMDFIVWRVLLGVHWAWGEVAPERLASWLPTIGFMFVHRTEHNLNSAIPYAALSNGLTPLAPDACNMAAVVRKVGIPPFNSTGIIDFYRYLRDIERNGRLPDFEKFQREHSQESMVSAWTCILSDELKQKQS